MSFAIQIGSTPSAVGLSRPFYEVCLMNGRQRERVLTSIHVAGNPDAALTARSLGTILAEAARCPLVAPKPSEPEPLMARL